MSGAPAAGPLQSLATLGLGYTLAIALAALVLLVALLAAALLCLRSYYRARSSNPNPEPRSDGVVLPRIIFVAEDDDGDAGRSPAAGLDPAAISSYPKFPFAGAGAVGDAACAICLCEYREGEMLRMLPDCRHRFHLLCVDAWLRLNASCPVCRTSPMPTPLSTPLSEVVPLSQFPAGQRRR